MKKLFLLCFPAFLLTACSNDKEIVTQQPLEEIYSEAYNQFEREHYETAAEKFLLVETQYPASQWAPEALIMAAYSQYMDNDFAGAILIADRFMRFHPGHPYTGRRCGCAYSGKDRWDTGHGPSGYPAP